MIPRNVASHSEQAINPKEAAKEDAAGLCTSDFLKHAAGQLADRCDSAAGIEMRRVASTQALQEVSDSLEESKRPHPDLLTDEQVRREVGQLLARAIACAKSMRTPRTAGRRLASLSPATPSFEFSLQSRILDSLKDGVSRSPRELLLECDTSRRSLIRAINVLIGCGAIEAVGSTRDRIYRLKRDLQLGAA